MPRPAHIRHGHFTKDSKMCRKILLLAALYFLTSCGYIPTTTPIVIGGERTFPEYLDGPSFDLLSWNIHKEGNGKAWIEDALNRECTRDPDFLAFQEASYTTGLEYTLRARDLDWRLVPNAIKYGIYTGVLTASKARPLENVPLISSVLEPFTKTPKSSLITTYELRSRNIRLKLLVANVHGINFSTMKSFDEHMEQIFDALTPLRRDHAVILAGDFNTWSEDRIESLNKKTSKLGLTELHITNLTTAPIIARALPTVTDTPLDHVYYSDDTLTIIRANVLDCVNSSDHKPIYVEFSIK